MSDYIDQTFLFTKSGIFPTSISKISICNNSSYSRDALKSSNIV